MLLFEIGAHFCFQTLSLCRLSSQFVFIKWRSQDPCSPPITLPISSPLSLRNSRASIIGFYSPYLGDLNGFSSLNPSSSLMAFYSEVLTPFTADPLRPAMGNVSFCREIRSPHQDNLYTQLRLTCLSLLLRFLFHLSFFFKSLSCTISQTYLHIHFHPCANTDSFNHTLRPTLNSYLSHV